MKFAEADGNSTGELCSVATSGSADYQIYNFLITVSPPKPSRSWKTIRDLLLVDAGKKGTSGTANETIELTSAQAMALR
jgi:hypothetical protein